MSNMKAYDLGELVRLCGGADRLVELARADSEKRVVILPHPLGTTVFAIHPDPKAPCPKTCPSWDKESDRCVAADDAPFTCPTTIVSAVVEAYGVYKDKDGNPYIGLRDKEAPDIMDFAGVDGKIYRSRKEAEQAQKEMEG